MNQLTKLAVCVAVSFGVAGFTSASIAASASTTFNVTVSIVDSCTVASKPLLARNYSDLSGTRLDEVVLTSPACPLVAAHTITRNAGNGIGATASNRQPTGHAGPLLTERVFSDAAGISVLPDNNGGAVHKFSLHMGPTQAIPVQGSVPVEQNAMVGSYADTLTVMLTY